MQANLEVHATFLQHTIELHRLKLAQLIPSRWVSILCCIHYCCSDTNMLPVGITALVLAYTFLSHH